MSSKALVERPTHCVYCRRPLEQRGRKPRHYCSGACKAAAWRRRQPRRPPAPLRRSRLLERVRPRPAELEDCLVRWGGIAPARARERPRSLLDRLRARLAGLLAPAG